jgi:transcriptional regulator GlxA family with amidase domain
LRRAHTAGARIVALCTGAFIVAAAGLLDGRTATTYWMHAAELAKLYPEVDVRADVLYVDDGEVLTSAGKTAALDLCLHIVHRDYGAAAANGLARRLVVPAHRPGGQAQFIAPPPDPRVTDRLDTALNWARARLDRPLSVQDLAREAGLSTRQLARRIRAEIGVSPLAWLHQQRITRAQDMLERTDASIEQIATHSGMGTATTLRRHFIRALGVGPTAYRATFRT